MSTKTEICPIKICIAMEKGPLSGSIKNVLQVLQKEGSLLFTERASEADIVIFTNVSNVGRDYDKNRVYAYLDVCGETPSLPEEVIVVKEQNTIIGLTNLIEKARKNFQPDTETPDSESEEPVILPGALHILVIDDTRQNIESAKKTLSGQYLTTASGYEEAMEILQKNNFDMVLTDLHLPMSSKSMGSKFRLGELVPYGILLMVEAARQGAKYVAVVTDLSHHDDPFSAAFDHYSSFSVRIEEAKVMMMHAHLFSDGSKNWFFAMNQLKNG